MRAARLEGAQAVLWLVLILAAGARQALLAGDNAALRRGLERRVSDQTADLRRLARQTEVLLSSVGDGIYGVDHEGRVTFINPSGAAGARLRAARPARAQRPRPVPRAGRGRPAVPVGGLLRRRRDPRGHAGHRRGGRLRPGRRDLVPRGDHGQPGRSTRTGCRGPSWRSAT